MLPPRQRLSLAYLALCPSKILASLRALRLRLALLPSASHSPPQRSFPYFRQPKATFPQNAFALVASYPLPEKAAFCLVFANTQNLKSCQLQHYRAVIGAHHIIKNLSRHHTLAQISRYQEVVNPPPHVLSSCATPV